MTNAKPSVLLTYVTYHDDIAYEHTRLFKLLRILLGDADRDELLKRNAEYLVEFLGLLERHHATEDALLQVLCPGTMGAHVQAHTEMTETTKKLLGQADSLSGHLFVTMVQEIRSMLYHHVATLDHELAGIVNGECRVEQD